MIYVLGIALYIFLAFWPAMVAKRKGHSFVLFFLLGIVTSFIIALIAAAMVSDRTMTSQDIKDDEAAEEALEKEYEQN